MYGHLYHILDQVPDLFKQKRHLEKGNWVGPKDSGKTREPGWIPVQKMKLDP